MLTMITGEYSHRDIEGQIDKNKRISAAGCAIATNGYSHDEELCRKNIIHMY